MVYTQWIISRTWQGNLIIGNNRNDPAEHCVKSAQILYSLIYGESKKADLIQVEIRVMATGGWGGCELGVVHQSIKMKGIN